MLIYHPAFDAYHCTFRIVALTHRWPIMDIDKARILDFLLAFPSAVLIMRIPHELQLVRSRIRTAQNPYRDPVSAKRTFADIRQVQLAALGSLAAAGYLDATQLEAGTVARTQKQVPDGLRDMAEEFMKKDSGLGDAIVSAFAPIPTFGPNGLKDRSGLLEFRYDNV